MPDEQKFYGLVDQEKLDDEVSAVVERAVDEACEVVGESFDEIAARMLWPIRVLVYRHAKMGTPEELGRIALDNLLEHLYEEYGSEDECGPDEPTDAMIQAATALGQAVRDGYTPWACVPTGEVIEVTMEQAREMLGEDKP
jgi:hypothetical protein